MVGHVVFCYNHGMSPERIALSNVNNGRSDRFSYAKIYRDEHWLFSKKANTSELEPNLQREILWANFVNTISEREPEAHIRGPQIFNFDEDGGLLMEYIEAPLVAASSDGAAWKEKINRYARTLSILDTYAEDYRVEWPPSDEMASTKNIEKTWQRWFRERYEDTLPILTKAHQLIADADINYRVQHGDLTPWQMFEQGQDWIIFDGEKAGDHLPRFSDLAYGYGRLFTRLRDRETAAKMLEKFIAYHGINQDVFFRQFLPVVTFRATGMLADAYNDREHDDYLEQANDLLTLCFNRQLRSFLPKE